MTDQNKNLWYVARRGELLAEQFLLDLAPDQLSNLQGPAPPFDYLAFFSKSDGTPVVIAVEVKTTQREIKRSFPLAVSSAQLKRWVNSNLPVLLVVADVKNNEVFFNWVRDAIQPADKKLMNRAVYPTVLRKDTSEEKEKLKREILTVNTPPE